MIATFNTSHRRRGARARRACAALALAAATSMLTLGGAGRAAVVEYTSQVAFNAAAPSATTSGFSLASGYQVEPNPFQADGLSFLDTTTTDDLVNGGEPLLFLISSSATPTYGRDFLSFQNTDRGIGAVIVSSGSSAIGFEYGSYIASGPATVTLSTGESFTIDVTDTPQFLGFTSTTPITSVSVDLPTTTGFSFDLLSVSTVSAAPEPASWLLLTIGVGGFGFALRRNRRMSAAEGAG